MESQNSQTVLKHTKQGTKQRELQVNLSEYYPLSRDTSLRYGIEPTPLQKFSSPRYRYSIPVRFLSPSGSVGALVSSSRLSDQINVTRPARYHFFTFTENEKPSWRKMIATGTFNTKPLLSYLSDLLLRDRTCATSTDDVYVSTLATW